MVIRSVKVFFWRRQGPSCHAQELYLSGFQLSPLDRCVLVPSPRHSAVLVTCFVCCSVTRILGDSQNSAQEFLVRNAGQHKGSSCPEGWKRKQIISATRRYKHMAIYFKIISLALLHWPLLWLPCDNPCDLILWSGQLRVNAWNDVQSLLCRLKRSPESPSCGNKLIFLLLKHSTFCSFGTWIQLPALVLPCDGFFPRSEMLF